jgi:hypothetical protein
MPASGGNNVASIAKIPAQAPSRFTFMQKINRSQNCCTQKIQKFYKFEKSDV